MIKSNNQRVAIRGEGKKEKKVKTVNMRSSEGLSCCLRKVSLICKSQDRSGVD